MNSRVPTVLLVDDEPLIAAALIRCLKPLQANLVDFTSPLRALEFAADNIIDLVISDQRMPEMLGSDMLTQIKQLHPRVQNIMLSAHNDFDAVADAFNQRLIDRYISKPWDNKELTFVVGKAIARQADYQTARPLTKLHGMLATDKAMMGVFDCITKAATANVPVFITGETGTGKELVAKACHLESYCSEKPFIAVNCANFTESLMESQLFGHNKGAFTGAVASQQGMFAAAGEGTLFLDEVTTIPLALQAKLLRVIQEREYAPLGSHQHQSFNAHIVTASSTSLAEAVNKGEFREDLYYRLNVITIDLPPLRKRGQDINLLAQHFLQRFNKLVAKSFKGFNHEAEKVLSSYHWPGNIRQLENLIHAIVVLNDQPEISAEMINQAISNNGLVAQSLTAKDQVQSNLQQNISQPASNNGDQAIIPLWQVERDAIERAITFCQGNIPKAAALLDVSASTIYRKRKQWLNS